MAANWVIDFQNCTHRWEEEWDPVARNLTGGQAAAGGGGNVIGGNASSVSANEIFASAHPGSAGSSTIPKWGLKILRVHKK